MADLIVYTEDGGRYRIPTGERRSVGRDADICLTTPRGVGIPWLHAEALVVGAELGHWTVEVPAGKKYEVRVTDTDSGLSQSVRPGEGPRRYTSLTAELELCPAGLPIRLKVAASGILRIASGVGSGTHDPPFLLDPDDKNHRVWIAACRDRLVHAGAGAVAWKEVADLLGSAGRFEDAHLTPNTAAKRAQRSRETHIDANSIAGDLPADANVVVDFLVRSGAVTDVELAAVLRMVDR